MVGSLHAVMMWAGNDDMFMTHTADSGTSQLQYSCPLQLLIHRTVFQLTLCFRRLSLVQGGTNCDWIWSLSFKNATQFIVLNYLIYSFQYISQPHIIVD